MRDGQRDGLVSRYYPSGQVQAHENWAAGSRQGPSRYYAETGRLVAAVTFRQGRKTGPVQEYYPDGRLRYTGRLYHGSRTGDYKEFYPLAQGGRVKTKASYCVVDGREVLNGYLAYTPRGVPRACAALPAIGGYPATVGLGDTLRLDGRLVCPKNRLVKGFVFAGLAATPNVRTGASGVEFLGKKGRVAMTALATTRGLRYVQGYVSDYAILDTIPSADAPQRFKILEKRLYFAVPVYIK